MFVLVMSHSHDLSFVALMTLFGCRFQPAASLLLLLPLITSAIFSSWSACICRCTNSIVSSGPSRLAPYESRGGRGETLSCNTNTLRRFCCHTLLDPSNAEWTVKLLIWQTHLDLQDRIKCMAGIIEQVGRAAASNAVCPLCCGVQLLPVAD